MEVNRYDIDTCRCIGDSRYEENATELINILAGRVTVSTEHKKILILTSLQNARISLNNLGIYLRQGANHLCICNIRKQPYESEITIVPDYYSTISTVVGRAPHMGVYYLAPRGHHPKCRNSTPPSLKFWAFSALYASGETNRTLIDKVLEGKIPWGLLHECPAEYDIAVSVNITNLVRFSPSFFPRTIPACTEKNHRTM